MTLLTHHFMRKIMRKTAILLIGLVVAVSPSFAADAPASTSPLTGTGKAHLVLLPLEAPHTIPGLHWDQTAAGENLEVKTEDGPSAIISGALPIADWTLVIDNTMFKLPNNGRFSHVVKLKGPLTVVEVLAIGPQGEVAIDYPDFSKKKKELIGLTPSLGISRIFFDQANKPNYTETAVTAKLNYTRKRGKDSKWDASFVGWGTVFSISHSGDAEARFLGLNLRVGYHVPLVQDPWGLTVYTGAYYTTMSVTNDEFGFRNEIGPQLAAKLTRALKNQDELQLNLKYAAISDTGNFDWLNREYAAGLGYQHVFANEHPGTISLDLSDLRVAAYDTSATSKSISLSAAYGF